MAGEVLDASAGRSCLAQQWAHFALGAAATEASANDEANNRGNEMQLAELASHGE